MKVVVPVPEGAISSSTLLKWLRPGPQKNATHAAFREVGRAWIGFGNRGVISRARGLTPRLR